MNLYKAWVRVFFASLCHQSTKTPKITKVFFGVIWCFGVLVANQSINAQNKVVSNDIKDSILLNSGKYIVAHVTDTNGFSVEAIKPHSHKHKKFEIQKEDIFSIKFGASGKESIYYVYDTLTGNDFTVEEARRFIAGEQDAQRGYHAFPTSAAAFAVGAISGASATFYTFAIPLSFAGFMSYKYVKISHKSVRDIENVKHDAYLYGYAFTARKKRLVRALLWGGIGMIAGSAYHFAFLNN